MTKMDLTKYPNINLPKLKSRISVKKSRHFEMAEKGKRTFEGFRAEIK